MKYTFENRNNGLCLVAELEKEQLHAFVYPMLINNKIPGVLIPTYERRANGQDALVYNVQGRVTLTDFLANYADKKTAWKACGMMKEMWRLLDEYMIPDRCCVWDKDCMYVNPADGDIGILCVPVDVYVSDPLDREAYAEEFERIIGMPVFVDNDLSLRRQETGILYGAIADEMKRVREEAMRGGGMEVYPMSNDTCESETTVLDSSMWSMGAMNMHGMPEGKGMTGELSKKKFQRKNRVGDYRKKERKTFAERRAERKERKLRKLMAKQATLKNEMKKRPQEAGYRIPGM